jgi:SMI1 / KNR4 family (SUKH-1)
MQALLERLKAHWLTDLVQARPGVLPAELDAFEARSCVRLPLDLRTYFAALDGSDDWVADDDFFRFMQLSECVPIADSFGSWICDEWADRYFLLIDQSLGVFHYAIGLSSDPLAPAPVVLRDGPGAGVVASSLTEFLDRYLQSDGSLYRIGAPMEL